MNDHSSPLMSCISMVVDYFAQFYATKEDSSRFPVQAHTKDHARTYLKIRMCKFAVPHEGERHKSLPCHMDDICHIESPVLVFREDIIKTLAKTLENQAHMSLMMHKCIKQRYTARFPSPVLPVDLSQDIRLYPRR